MLFSRCLLRKYDVVQFCGLILSICGAPNVCNGQMTGSGGVSASDLLLNHSVSFEASTLLLRFEATLKYVGESADGVMDHSNNLGTTYWIDLQSFSEFDSMDNGIANAGSCGNRRAADYGPLTFGEFWKYTVDPADLANASNADRMAYPPSDWTLSASGCNAVNYERTFSLAVWWRSLSVNEQWILPMSMHIVVCGVFRIWRGAPTPMALGLWPRSRAIRWFRSPAAFSSKWCRRTGWLWTAC